MLAKITSKNQLTLPKSITQSIGPVEYFDVTTNAGQIILTPVRIQRGDGLVVLRGMDAASVDLVFLDPPFDSDRFDAALQAAAAAVRPNGWVYLEAPTLWTDTLLTTTGLVVVRHLKAGNVHAHLLRPWREVPRA